MSTCWSWITCACRATASSSAPSISACCSALPMVTRSRSACMSNMRKLEDRRRRSRREPALPAAAAAPLPLPSLDELCVRFGSMSCSDMEKTSPRVAIQDAGQSATAASIRIT